jgi:hypothetical protein
MPVCDYIYSEADKKYHPSCKESNGRKFKSWVVARFQKDHTRIIVHPIFGEMEVSFCPYCKRELATAR